MPRPLCVKCQVEYRPECNDIAVEEMASFGSYRIWFADLWKCPVCGNEIITGYGQKAFAEHFEVGYMGKLFALRADRKVYKCLEASE